jgi:hypothetical protein
MEFNPQQFPKGSEARARSQERRQKVQEHLEENEQATTSELAEEIYGDSSKVRQRQVVKAYLEPLKIEGEIEKDNNGIWKKKK